MHGAEIHERRLTLPAVELAYLEVGDPDAPLAVCLHGFPDHARSWTPLLADLAEAGWHAVAPWLRGYAPSGLATDGVHDPAAAVADLELLVEQLGGAAPAVLVGHDWGALVTWGAAAAFPQRLARVVTMAVPHPATVAVPLLTDYDLQKRSWYQFLFQLEGMSEMIVSLNDFAFLDRIVREWSPGWEPPEPYRAGVREALTPPGHLSAALGYYRSMFSPAGQSPLYADVRGELGAPAEVPVLLLMGVDDGLYDPGIFGDLAPFCHAGVEVALVESAGHFMLHEQPERVSSLILEFLGSP